MGSIEHAVALMLNGDDDAALLALKLNVFNIVNNELGQPSWHFNTVETGFSPHHNELLNASIDTRQQQSKDVFSYKKRFSLSLEGPSEHFPMTFTELPDLRGNISMHTKYLDHIETPGDKTRKKRRLSNLGCLTSSFFEDYAKAVRRGSMASSSTFAASNRGSRKCESDDDDSVISQMSERISFEYTKIQSHQRLQYNLHEINVKEALVIFYDSMSMSQKSQLAIHDWDKKMGLKRSHSKTMRLSMRSRKKLKTMIKKDMIFLSSR